MASAEVRCLKVVDEATKAKCGSLMEVRESNSEKNAGRQYYKCSASSRENDHGFGGWVGEESKRPDPNKVRATMGGGWNPQPPARSAPINANAILAIQQKLDEIAAGVKFLVEDSQVNKRQKTTHDE
jgi:hypothetical protein